MFIYYYLYTEFSLFAAKTFTINALKSLGIGNVSLSYEKLCFFKLNSTQPCTYVNVLNI